MIEDNAVLQFNPPVEKALKKQVKITVDETIAVKFKDACMAAGTPMATVLSRFMAGFSNAPTVQKPLPDYSTRKQRRRAIRALTKQIKQIRDYEEQYRDRIPDSLQGSIVYERADELVSMLDEVIDLMASV